MVAPAKARQGFARNTMPITMARTFETQMGTSSALLVMPRHSTAHDPLNKGSKRSKADIHEHPSYEACTRLEARNEWAGLRASSPPNKVTISFRLIQKLTLQILIPSLLHFCNDDYYDGRQ